MAQIDALKKYLDAGMAFTSLSRARAEQLVKDLVAAGDLQRSQAKDAIDDLLERSRKNAEAFSEQTRREVDSYLGGLGLARKADVERLQAELAELKGTGAKAGGDKKPETAQKSTEKKAEKKPEAKAERSERPTGPKPEREAAAGPSASGGGRAGVSAELPAKKAGQSAGGSGGAKAPAKKTAKRPQPSGDDRAGVSGQLPAKKAGQSEGGSERAKAPAKKTAKKQG